jgi:HEAT repeat protein
MRKHASQHEQEAITLAQPALFNFTETTSGAVELFPAVWSAVEDLTSPQPLARRSALLRIKELSAHRLSPLVAYILATRLADPDLDVRVGVIRLLAEILTPDPQGRQNAENVNRHLVSYLSQMDAGLLTAILEAVEMEPDVEALAARLVNYCPSAGTFLTELLIDRKKSLPLRRQAVRLIGLVGFLEALPGLEKLEARLVSRRNGQQLMPFAPPSTGDEMDLLPHVQKSLFQLRYT